MKLETTSGMVALCGLAICAVGGETNRVSSSAARTPKIVSVQKIWSAAGHNAFTDLIRFQDHWFCTFREAQAHVGGNGEIRLLVSQDGDRWQSAALVKEEGIDLRDPKLSITPDGRLMLVMGGSVYETKKLVERQPRVAFSKDGRDWSAPRRALEKGDWLWRVTWHNGHAYGIAYSIPPNPPSGEKGTADWSLKLVESNNGADFRVVAPLEVPSRPNEATVRFLANGDCVALVRREGFDRNSDNTAWIGVSQGTYRQWKWKPAGMQIGGPNFLVLPDGSMVASGRQYGSTPGSAKTFVGRMDLESVSAQLVLPSGGDCSYPGLVWFEDRLWVSYYSSHEGRASIYLAKVTL
jgi:hypothetical protein